MNLKRIETLLSQMSLEDKLRQITQLHFKYIKKDTSAEMTGVDSPLQVSAEDVYGLGSTLNLTEASEAIEVQNHHLQTDSNKIPLCFMMDVIHGFRTIFPIPLARGGACDEALIEEVARISALEAKYNGISVTFSPMVDLARDARWGRVLETTGEDAYLNGVFGKAFIRGYHAGGIACCVKHYAAYGAPEAGREYNTTDISERNLKEYYLPAYRECLKESPELFMSSFNLLNGIPVNGRRDLLVDTLREEWGFDGVLISDFNGVREMIAHGYAETEKDCAEICLQNQVDIEMMSATYIHSVKALIEEGKLTMETVDRAVRRVLILKEKLGLFDNPYFYADEKKAKEICLCEAHRTAARIAAEKTIVLLKNDGVLPLSKDAKLAIVGPFAQEKLLIGAWSCMGLAEDCVDVVSGVENLLGKTVPTAIGCCADILSTDTADIAQAVACSQSADIIVACIGEPRKYAGEAAARAKLELPQPQIDLLSALKATGKKVVAVIFGGRPQVLTQAEKLADAILYAYHPGTEGGNAIANLLFGEASPSAKITMSFPRTTGQCPIYYNAFATGKPKAIDTLEGSGYNSSYRDELNAPLYPFGYGLSYTSFSISDLRLTKKQMRAGESICASVTVKNTGTRFGEEVVQLYLRDLFASVVRPVKELKAYRKVALGAGESKEVQFEITEETLKFWTANGVFAAESGEFEVMVGNSSVSVIKERFFFTAQGDA